MSEAQGVTAHYNPDRYKAACTWGDGPDVMIIDELDPDRFMDLSLVQAIRLSVSLQEAIAKAFEIEMSYLRSCVEHEGGEQVEESPPYEDNSKPTDIYSAISEGVGAGEDWCFGIGRYAAAQAMAGHLIREAWEAERSCHSVVEKLVAWNEKNRPPLGEGDLRAAFQAQVRTNAAIHFFTRER